MTEVADTSRALVAVDRIDPERWNLDAERRDEPAAIAADVAALDARRAEVARLEGELERCRSDVATAEKELDGVDRRRNRAKKRLAEVFTSTQIEATQREIETLSERAGELEEETLLGMERGEELQVQLGKERAGVEQDAADRAGRRAAWADRDARIGARVAALDAERAPLWSGLRSDVARRYKVGWNMPYYKPPSGLTSANGGVCTTCRTSISARWVQECRAHTALHACDSCKRILVFDPDAPPPITADVE